MFFPIHVVGISMLPTIERSQIAVVEQYWFWQQPQRGEIITFWAPPQPTRQYCKSILGHLVYLYDSKDNTGFLPDVSVVYAHAHQTGVFQTGFTSGNNAFLLLL